MIVKQSRAFPRAELETLLDKVPFYREVRARDGWQFELLLDLTQCVELQPGEPVVRRGEQGHTLYFLVKGELGVYLHEQDAVAVSQITPGESFGDLALLTRSERQATVRACSARGALLVGLDFRPFADFRDFSTLDLATKLCFYRLLVHSIRWRLERARMQRPEHPVFIALRQVKSFAGARDSAEELVSLAEQAAALAGILVKWNACADPVG